MNKGFTARDIAYTGLFAALIFVAGSVVKVPTFGGFAHAGDSMVLLAAFMLGTKRGAVASSIGMVLVDVLGGYMLWAPFTLVIKFVMALIAGVVLDRTAKRGWLQALAAFSAAGAFMVIGYFLAGIVMATMLTDDASGFAAGVLFASQDIFSNILQALVGVVIALPLCAAIPRLTGALKNNG